MEYLWIVLGGHKWGSAVQSQLFIKTADFIQDRQFPGTVDLMLTNISNTTKFGFGLF